MSQYCTSNIKNTNNISFQGTAHWEMNFTRLPLRPCNLRFSVFWFRGSLLVLICSCLHEAIRGTWWSSWASFSHTRCSRRFWIRIWNHKWRFGLWPPLSGAFTSLDGTTRSILQFHLLPGNGNRVIPKLITDFATNMDELILWMFQPSLCFCKLQIFS